ncbi:hypothetical protein KTR10_02210 [Candidatus Kaiserbacteria bacterium]|nr:hypothetical protein [Candidatus Kaiserbacteria bacterium]
MPVYHIVLHVHDDVSPPMCGALEMRRHTICRITSRSVSEEIEELLEFARQKLGFKNPKVRPGDRAVEELFKEDLLRYAEAARERPEQDAAE